MDNVCSVCQAMAEPHEHDCLEILSQQYAAIQKSVVLNNFATEDQLLSARQAIKPLVVKYRSVLESRRMAVKEAERRMEQASRSFTNVEKYAQDVTTHLVQKLGEI